VACDIDAEAVPLVRESIRCVQALFYTGSARSLRDSSADVVVANINAETCIRIARELKAVARRVIIVSGFRDDDVERVGSAFAGFGSVTVTEQDGWACVTALR
jgi:ribosomal protein L11 methylase PrmA